MRAMKYLLLATALMFTLPAHAQTAFGGSDINKPKGMVVAGSSVIDKNSSASSSAKNVQEVRDDAHSMMKPEKTAPATPEIDPFSPAPQVDKPENVKRVLKKVPAAKIQRSIADDRIDDTYVQRMMKKNLDFTGPIE